MTRTTTLRYSCLTLTAGLAMAGTSAFADQVIADDLIVNGGSICAGLDCVNGESFGFDTLKLKENNLRIKADDTSTSASFPSTDWQITFNESDNGGANKFSIEDISASRTPMTILGGAPSNSLYVDAAGDVGFGNSNPVVELHVSDGDTPTLRLEQDGSSGFTPQVFDIAANETNFFIRDVTNGSRLGFRMRPGAPESSIDIAADGDVGFGTGAPTAAMHLRRTNGTAKMLIQDTAASLTEALLEVEAGSATTGARTVMSLKNQGAVRFLVENTANSAQWLTSYGGDVRIAPSNNVADQVFLLASNGNLIIGGTLTENSDKNAKMAIEPVDPAEVLEKLSQLEVSHWTYKDDD
ncbi:MAG: hypothetical protein AAGL90_17835, partial [Pseudomonadota bacterium]